MWGQVQLWKPRRLPRVRLHVECKDEHSQAGPPSCQQGPFGFSQPACALTTPDPCHFPEPSPPCTGSPLTLPPTPCIPSTGDLALIFRTCPRPTTCAHHPAIAGQSHQVAA